MNNWNPVLVDVLLLISQVEVQDLLPKLLRMVTKFYLSFFISFVYMGQPVALSVRNKQPKLNAILTLYMLLNS